MIMKASFIVVIPARYGSSRFPGKILADIQGKPMIAHVVERALEAGAAQVIVATDNERIARAVSPLCQVQMTRADHDSGTERIAEVVSLHQFIDEQIIVNVQGDEPFIAPELIHQVAQVLDNEKTQMATLCTAITNREEVVNPNTVKVVRNNQQRALYFSRASIPFEREALLADITDTSRVHLEHLRRHLGIYAYTAGYIKQYVSYAPSPLEQIESLEQLRALWYGDTITVADAIAPAPSGVDTPDDLARLLSTLP